MSPQLMMTDAEAVEWLAAHPRERAILVMAYESWRRASLPPRYEAIIEALDLVSTNQIYRSVMKLRAKGLLHEGAGHTPSLIPTPRGVMFARAVTEQETDEHEGTRQH